MDSGIKRTRASVLADAAGSIGGLGGTTMNGYEGKHFRNNETDEVRYTNAQVAQGVSVAGEKSYGRRGRPFVWDGVQVGTLSRGSAECRVC